jgi:peptidoglycan/xylan/chitin deacetylase (PgdA/CDA1 family)
MRETATGETLRVHEAGDRVAFTSTDPFMFFDVMRVPYRVDDGPVQAAGRWGRCSADGGVELFWLREPDGGRDRAWGRHRLAEFSIFGSVLPDALARDALPPGHDWRAADPLTDAAGERIASVWRDPEGNVALPFDPGETMRNLWSERYLHALTSATGSRVMATLRRAYYRARPMIPRRIQILMRRGFASTRSVPEFPAWPVETSLLDLYDWLFETVATVAGAPVPWIAPWPDGHDWAFVLTHDVETDIGCRAIPALRDIERDHGLRSSWNFVPLRYDAPQEVLQGLRDEGCEIGVHGLLHDGRDLESLRMIQRRLPAMREHAERWGAVGFRAPATQRNWEWMPMLGFDYDSSYPDSDPYEPQAGGCCSWLPFLNDSASEAMVELPITVPQDHTVFEILRHGDEAVWLEKVRAIRARGGMALVLTHPDYTTDPNDGRIVDGYRRLLDAFGADGGAWQALPKDVSAWWRARQATRIQRRDGEWSLDGPAADRARIRLVRPGERAFGPGD